MDSHHSSNRNRVSASRIGGLSLHAKGDSYAIAARARGGLEEKFRAEALAVNPNLTGTALEQKIALFKRLHYARLGRLSAAKRRRKSNSGHSPP